MENKFEQKYNTNFSSILNENFKHKNNKLSTHNLWLNKLLTSEECEKLIEITEIYGYGKTTYDQSYRGNLRLICDDKNLALKLWPRVEKILGKNFHLIWEYKEEYGGEKKIMVPIGLNTRFRFSKYYPNTKFEKHIDGYFSTTNQVSMLTMNIYLNNNEASTRIYNKNFTIDIKPRTGAALIFQQSPMDDILHEGLIVNKGIKYLMRTDVMFKPIN